MLCQRKGTNDAIHLRLAMNEKTTEELQQIVSGKNGRSFTNDSTTRKAALSIMKFRGVAT